MSCHRRAIGLATSLSCGSNSPILVVSTWHGTMLLVLRRCAPSAAANVAVLLPWDAVKKLHTRNLRPVIADAAREALQPDLKRRWIDELPKSLRHFFLVSSRLDPSPKDLRADCFLLDNYSTTMGDYMGDRKHTVPSRL